MRGSAGIWKPARCSSGASGARPVPAVCSPGACSARELTRWDGRLGLTLWDWFEAEDVVPSAKRGNSGVSYPIPGSGLGWWCERGGQRG